MAFFSQTNSNIVCMVIRCQESNAFSTLLKTGHNVPCHARGRKSKG